MKQPKRGQIVQWFEGGNRAHGSAVGIVTEVGPQAIRVNIFHPGSSVVRPTGWIRHIDDEYYKSHQAVAARDGAWDWLEQDKPKDPLDAAMEALDGDVEFMPATKPTKKVGKK